MSHALALRWLARPNDTIHTGSVGCACGSWRVTLPMALPIAADGAPLLRVDGLSFAYPSQPLFDNWSAQFTPGLHLLCGDESCGKTSLLRLLAGDLMPQAGSMQLGPYLFAEDAQSYRKQLFRTDPTSDAFDSVTPIQWFDSLRGTRSAFDVSRAEELLSQLSLQEHLNKTGHMLSTGSRRKVWLAAALASNAALVLIDQPFAALDAPSIRAVTAMLQAIGQEARRIVIIADYEPPPRLALHQTLRL